MNGAQNAIHGAALFIRQILVENGSQQTIAIALSEKASLSSISEDGGNGTGEQLDVVQHGLVLAYPLDISIVAGSAKILCDPKPAQDVKFSTSDS